MALLQLDTENADRNLTSEVACLTHTPSASVNTLCFGYIALGDGAKDLDGTGGDFELRVTVGGQTIQPGVQVITFGTQVRSGIFTAPFPVPANQEVILYVKSPNGADTDIDVTAYLYDQTAALPAALPDAAGGLPVSDAGGLDIDAKLANTNEVTAARMGALTDWIDGGRLDLLLDAIPTTAMRGTDNALAPTVPGRTLDVTATGEAGIDWANIGGKTSAVNLAGTQVGFVNVLNGHTAQTGDNFPRIGAPVGASISADLTGWFTSINDLSQAQAQAAAAAALAAWGKTGFSLVTDQSGVTIGTVNTLTGHTAQTGDSYAIVNNEDYGNVALEQLVDQLEERLTAARAGYLDKLNVAGTLAHSDAAATYKADVSALALEASLSDGSVTLHSDYDAAKTAAAAGAAMTLTVAERNSIADAVFVRDMDQVEAAAPEHSLCTVILATLESSLSGTTWTIKRTDGSTTHATKTVTTDSAADPITGVT